MGCGLKKRKRYNRLYGAQGGPGSNPRPFSTLRRSDAIRFPPSVGLDVYLRPHGRPHEYPRPRTDHSLPDGAKAGGGCPRLKAHPLKNVVQKRRSAAGLNQSRTVSSSSAVYPLILSMRSSTASFSPLFRTRSIRSTAVSTSSARQASLLSHTCFRSSASVAV